MNSRVALFTYSNALDPFGRFMDEVVMGVLDKERKYNYTTINTNQGTGVQKVLDHVK